MVGKWLLSHGTEENMRKQNNGFSLVELIVVIAIMAVLVGVLAPAYLKYVEKSRRAKDITMLDEVVRAASAVAAEEEYHVPNKVIFYVEYDHSAGLQLNIVNWNEDNNIDADWQDYLELSEHDWRDISNNVNNNATFHSKTWKGEDGNFCGIVNPVGCITWYYSDCHDVFEDIVDYSDSFKSIFSMDTKPADVAGLDIATIYGNDKNR